MSARVLSAGATSRSRYLTFLEMIEERGRCGECLGQFVSSVTNRLQNKSEKASAVVVKRIHHYAPFPTTICAGSLPNLMQYTSPATSGFRRCILQVFMKKTIS